MLSSPVISAVVCLIGPFVSAGSGSVQGLSQNQSIPQLLAARSFALTQNLAIFQPTDVFI